MAYGAKSSEIQEKSYLSYGEYENGNISLIDVNPAKKRAKGEETDDVCDIIFNHKQGQYQYRFFNPDTDTDEVRKEKNSAHYSKVFAYIAKKLTGKDQEVPDTISSWEELTAWFLAAVGPREVYSKVRLNFKIVGNVWEGKGKVGFTNYFGWLERVDSEKKPKFSPNEVAGNNAYDEWLKKRQPKAKTEDGEGEGAEGGDLAF